MKKNTYSTLIALGMIAIMGYLMFSTLPDETIIIDEDPHIGSGYSYLKAGDFRLNPEHPPLMKDIGALPLLAMDLKEPWDHKSWTTDLNGQWEFGRALIFGSGNDADAITQVVKVPMIVFALLLGLAIFFWTRYAFGSPVALITTFFYALSPTFLAHGRFVTTDVGAAAGFFIATVAFLEFLKRPTNERAGRAGLALGFALLAKFSTFMLLPIFFALLAAWVLMHRHKHTTGQAEYASSEHAHMPFSSWYKAHSADHKHPEDIHTVPFWGLLFKFIGVVIVAYLAIFPLYWHHTRNYPIERQISDTTAILETNIFGGPRAIANLMERYHFFPEWQRPIHDFPKNIVIWMSGQGPVLRAYAEYFLGLMMVFQRAVGGNTTYFMGEVNNTGFFWYFPIVYLIKEPLALHVLGAIALGFALIRMRKSSFSKQWVREHFIELAFLFVIAFYWWASMRSILNIGVRHVLPTFPFIYILTALGIVRLHAWLSAYRAPARGQDGVESNTQNNAPYNPALAVPRAELRPDMKKGPDVPALSGRSLGSAITLWMFGFAVMALLAWQAYGVLRVHPFYLAYFNEIAGGPEGGAKWVVDSNLDWGQDLKRLAQFVEANDIQEIYLDYFGWADPYYYLGDKRKWLSSCDAPRVGWVAVSASFYQGSFEKPECDYQRWIPLESRVTSIGHSIYVFHVE